MGNATVSQKRRISTLQGEIDKLQNKVVQLDRIKAQNKKYATQIQEFKTQHETQSKEIGTLNSTKENQIKQIKILNETNSQQRDQITSYDTQIQTLTKSHEKLRQENLRRMDALKTSNSTLKESLDKQKQENNALKILISKKQTEFGGSIEEGKREVAEQQARVLTLQKKLQKNEDALLKAKIASKKLEDEINEKAQGQENKLKLLHTSIEQKLEVVNYDGNGELSQDPHILKQLNEYPAAVEYIKRRPRNSNVSDLRDICLLEDVLRALEILVPTMRLYCKISTWGATSSDPDLIQFNKANKMITVSVESPPPPSQSPEKQKVEYGPFDDIHENNQSIWNSMKHEIQGLMNSPKQSYVPIIMVYGYSGSGKTYTLTHPYDDARKRDKTSVQSQIQETQMKGLNFDKMEHFRVDFSDVENREDAGVIPNFLHDLYTQQHCHLFPKQHCRLIPHRKTEIKLYVIEQIFKNHDSAPRSRFFESLFTDPESLEGELYCYSSRDTKTEKSFKEIFTMINDHRLHNTRVAKTPNNTQSSRGHLWYVFDVHDKRICFVDMGGCEDTVNMVRQMIHNTQQEEGSETGANQNVQSIRNTDLDNLLQGSENLKYTINREYKRTFTQIIKQGVYINETLNHLMGFLMSKIHVMQDKIDFTDSKITPFLNMYRNLKWIGSNDIDGECSYDYLRILNNNVLETSSRQHSEKRFHDNKIMMIELMHAVARGSSPKIILISTFKKDNAKVDVTQSALKYINALNPFSNDLTGKINAIKNIVSTIENIKPASQLTQPQFYRVGGMKAPIFLSDTRTDEQRTMNSWKKDSVMSRWEERCPYSKGFYSWLRRKAPNVVCCMYVTRGPFKIHHINLFKKNSTSNEYMDQDDRPMNPYFYVLRRTPEPVVPYDEEFTATMPTQPYHKWQLETEKHIQPIVRALDQRSALLSESATSNQERSTILASANEALINAMNLLPPFMRWNDSERDDDHSDAQQDDRSDRIMTNKYKQFLQRVNVELKEQENREQDYNRNLHEYKEALQRHNTNMYESVKIQADKLFKKHPWTLIVVPESEWMYNVCRDYLLDLAHDDKTNERLKARLKNLFDLFLSSKTPAENA